MAGTDVTYNGITLKNVLTRNWDMQAVYDEDDTLSYYKISMQFETIFLPYSGGENMGVTAGNRQYAPDTWNFTKRKLLAPRKQLTITMNGVTVLDVTPFTKNSTGYISGQSGIETDCKNGPKPIGLDFDTVMGSTSIRASYSIEAYLSPCDTKIPPVLASRWSVMETMDEDFFITRTFNGFVKKQSGVQSSASYRWWMYPPLEPGFKRTNVTFDEHADHLGIDWQVTDRQVHTAPPWPCTKLEGSQTETTGNGIVWHSEVRVRASGSPEASKRDMFAQCARIIEMRIGYAPDDAIGKGNKFLMKGCTMVDFFGAKNQVEMVMRIEHNWGANEQKKDKFKTFLTNLRGRIADPAYYDLATKAPGTPVNEPEPYDKLKSRLPWVWGYTPHGAKRTADLSARWEHYLTNLCTAQDRPSKFGVGDPKTTGTETETATDSPTTVDVDKPISTDENMFDSEEQQELYTLARVEDEYAYDPRVAVLPVLTDDHDSGLSSYVVNIGKPTIYRILTVEYERLGSWPAIPDLKPKYKDPLSKKSFQLVKHRVVAKPPNPGQDGKQVVYAVWAQYVYVCKSDLKKKTLADWDWSLISLPMTTLTHHIEHKKLWRDVNGGKLDSGKGSETSSSSGGT